MAERAIPFGEHAHDSRWCDQDPAFPGAERCRYRLLLETADLIGQARTAKDLFADLVPRIFALSDAQFLNFSLYDEHQECILAHSWQRGQEGGEIRAFPVEDCVSGWGWKHQEPVLISDTLDQSRFPASTSALQKCGVRSYAVFPMTARNRRVGALGVGKCHSGIPSQEDLTFFEHLARMVALAVENQESFQRLEKQKERLHILLETGAGLARSGLEAQELSPQISAAISAIVPHDLLVISVPDEEEDLIQVYTAGTLLGDFLPGSMKMSKKECLSYQLGKGEIRRFGYEELETLASTYPLVAQAVAREIRSACALELHSARGHVGYLSLASRSERAFQESDVELLRSATDELALVIENHSIQLALRRERDRLGTLLLSGTSLVGLELRSNELFPQIVSTIRSLFPNDLTLLTLLDEPSQAMRVLAFDPPSYPLLSDRVPVSSSMSAELMRGEPRIFNRKEIEELATRFPAARQGLEQGHVTFCALPLATAKKKIGVLYLSSKQERAFSPSDLRLLRPLAVQVALLAENALAHQALAEEKERLQLLLEVSTQLTSNRDFKTLFPALAAALREVVRHDFASVCVRHDASRGLRVCALDLPPSELNGDAEVLICPTNSPFSLTFRDREARIYNRADIEEYGLELIPTFAERGVQSLCCVPLITANGVIGVLTLANREDQAFTHRDLEILSQASAQVAIAVENVLAYHEIERLKDRLAQEKRYLENEIHGEVQPGDVVGKSPLLKRVLDQAAIVAETDSTVLITGETGTGKERVARAIHALSQRNDRNFVKLNCAAIPTGLLESELFGHEKGAFTGAISQKVGRLELADKGTLFLDEIGEIPLELQPKLLRVLQDQEFERLGSTRTIHVDVRIIAATNRDLQRAVASKEFRTDLFYRLHVFPLHLPALRERREDIPLLVKHFVDRFSVRLRRHIEIIPDEAIAAMLNWNWPGNIRELENFIERSVILSTGRTLRAPLAELRGVSGHPEGGGNTLREKEREHIMQILRQTRGVLSGPTGAAARLGLKRTTLQYKMQKLGISRAQCLN